jgi:hypothetical protein
MRRSSGSTRSESRRVWVPHAWSFHSRLHVDLLPHRPFRFTGHWRRRRHSIRRSHGPRLASQTVAGTKARSSSTVVAACAPITSIHALPLASPPLTVNLAVVAWLRRITTRVYGSAHRRWEQWLVFYQERVGPNPSLERTHQTVIKSAYANLPPVWWAAQLNR